MYKNKPDLCGKFGTDRSSRYTVMMRHTYRDYNYIFHSLECIYMHQNILTLFKNLRPTRIIKKQVKRCQFNYLLMKCYLNLNNQITTPKDSFGQWFCKKVKCLKINILFEDCSCIRHWILIENMTDQDNAYKIFDPTDKTGVIDILPKHQVGIQLYFFCF